MVLSLVSALVAAGLCGQTASDVKIDSARARIGTRCSFLAGCGLPCQKRKQVLKFLRGEPLVVIGGHRTLFLVDDLLQLVTFEHVYLVVGAKHLERKILLIHENSRERFPIACNDANRLIGS